MKLIVVNKWTYLFLLLPVIGIIKLFLYDIQFLDNILNFGYQLFISILIAIVGIYFFVKFNSRSQWMNPDHPKE